MSSSNADSAVLDSQSSPLHRKNKQVTEESPSVPTSFDGNTTVAKDTASLMSSNFPPPPSSSIPRSSSFPNRASGNLLQSTPVRLSNQPRDANDCLTPLDLPRDPVSMPLSSSFPTPSRHLDDKTKLTNEKKMDRHHPLEKVLGLEDPPLPSPKAPSKCPLFCCFYAEFDIKVGPKVCFQSPRNFMDQDMDISTERIHAILSKTFERFNNRNNQGVPSGSKEKESSGDGQSRENRAIDEEETADEDTVLPDGALSIFDSTSEYIITGNELIGKTINLSTHGMHILTRPTIISDERYERNALLFSVGFVLRRTTDPRPFRPLLSKWALTLRSMEVESHFLSKPSLRPHLQRLLERILISLNSSQWECNLLLNQSNALNLKLFHPPKPAASPVHDHEVPILLRKDMQLQMYDWDLAINWVILHIDGVTNARLISIKAEVDMEMVRACLRVLKHHGVIALVDMFMYSNRYEFTERAAAMLAGKDPKLLQETVDFVVKLPSFGIPPGLAGLAPVFGGCGSESDSSNHQQSSSPNQYTSYSSYPPRTMGFMTGRSPNLNLAMMAAQSLEKDPLMIPPRREDQRNLKAAIAELYCACNRNISFGDLWIALTTEGPSSSAFPSQQRSLRARAGSVNLQRRDASRKSPAEFVIDADPLDSLALSPVEATHLETLRHSDTGGNIDWNDVFKRFDHRRFTSFGLVHGLLVRVHGYPYFPGPFPEINSISMQSTASSEGRHGSRNEAIDDRSYQLARKVASLMDGTRCDDEFVCMFEKPYSQLVDLVEKFGGRKIVSVYATSPDC